MPELTGGWERGEVAPRIFVERARTTSRRWDTFFAFAELTKPKSVSLLVFTAVAGMVAAAATYAIRPTWSTFLLGLSGIGAGCAGCNAVTCYIDRDVDRVMDRTRGRPLPMGRIHPAGRALTFGLGLLLLALVLAWMGNLVAVVFMALGILDNVVVYSLWLKRSSPWSIILGGFSGGMPVAFGWGFVSGTIDAASILLASIVVLWTPTHIWSLALRYKEDYARARIPMLPVVASEKTALRCMTSTAALLVPFSLALPLVIPVAGFGYLLVAAGLGLPLLGMSLWLWCRPTRERAWMVFKFSNPYLALVFLALVLDAIF